MEVKDTKYREHIIDNLMPRCEVHIVGGPSGSGKTRWLLGMLEGWRHDPHFFGHKVNPEPFVYISGDRSERGMKRTMESMNIDWSTFPMYIPRRSADADITLKFIIDQARQKHPEAKLFIIEGIAQFVKDGKIHDYKAVSGFLVSAQQLCEKYDITIIGVCHSPKVKKDEKYINPREKIMGSAAWAAYAELICFLEPNDPEDDQDKSRSLWILPRNAAEERFQMDFSDGLLKRVEVKKKATNAEKLAEFLSTIGDDGLFTKAQAEIGTELPDSSIRFELKKALEQRRIEVDPARPAGTYRKLKSN